MAAKSYGEYRTKHYFPVLDGVRAVSILLVLAWHASASLFGWLSGFEGVTIFFVLSGYLITMVCLREEEDSGRVSLRSFFIRRAGRIMPLYILVLGAYAVASVGANWHEHRHAFVQALPYYVSYLNDFAPGGASTPFIHSWSLAVEEKFYILWPPVAFLLLAARPRARLATAALLAVLPWALVPLRTATHYPAYGSIMVGCVLALFLHDRRTYVLLRRVAGPAAMLLVAAFVAVHVVAHESHFVAIAIYPFAAALLLLSLLVVDSRVGHLLAKGPVRFVGRRAYGIYLVHPICFSITVAFCRHLGLAYDVLGQPSGRHRVVALIPLAVLGGGASLVVADWLHRTVEQRGILLARRLAAREPLLDVPSRGWSDDLSARTPEVTS
jgi:peptidoglycan/LPS O-acetylase OafA/YrhL